MEPTWVSGILARGGGLKLPKALYGHDDLTCPDLKDSVYLTPTSDDPFDPLPIACALGQMKRGSPPGNFEIPARYTHKKLLKGRKNEWCTYNVHTYAKDDWFNTMEKIKGFEISAHEQSKRIINIQN